MGHVGSHDHDGPSQDVRSVAAVESLVGSSQLAVDLQQNVVQGGWLDVDDVLNQPDQVNVREVFRIMLF